MPLWKKGLLLFPIVFIGLMGWGYMELFGTWKVFSIGRLTQITQIQFPPSTSLVSAYDQHLGPSEIAVAELQIPYKDLAAFQSQARMGPFKVSTPAELSPSILKEFRKSGLNPARARNLQCAFFADGSCTYVWIDRDSPQQATVYFYYDEP